MVWPPHQWFQAVQPLLSQRSPLCQCWGSSRATPQSRSWTCSRRWPSSPPAWSGASTLSSSAPSGVCFLLGALPPLVLAPRVSKSQGGGTQHFFGSGSLARRRISPLGLYHFMVRNYDFIQVEVEVKVQLATKHSMTAADFIWEQYILQCRSNCFQQLSGFIVVVVCACVYEVISDPSYPPPPFLPHHPVKDNKNLKKNTSEFF